VSKGNGQAGERSALTAAAAAVESEIHRYTDLAAAAVRIPLSSEKNVERASRAITEAVESEKRVLEHVQALMQAITGAREAQQSSAESLNTHAVAVAQKRTELDLLLARFNQLGEVAKTLNAAMQKVAGYKPASYHKGREGHDGHARVEGGEGPAQEAEEVAEAIQAMETGMTTCAEHAEELAGDAEKHGFEDLGRQADSLRQQILAVKNRLSLLKKGLEEVPAARNPQTAN
jgi:uncharacterized coiled-coil DUF342 family protein